MSSLHTLPGKPCARNHIIEAAAATPVPLSEMAYMASGRA